MAILLRSKSQIFGLNQDLQNLQLSITTEESRATGAEAELRNALGNEVVAREEAVSALNAATLKKAENLADLTDKAQARANLGVSSTSEVDAKINAAKIALGSNYTVADIAERDALVDLTAGDMVFVTNDGDGKWAQYQVASVGEQGVSFIKVMDQDIYLNAISAGAVKAAYESNADTNGFTDAEKAKLAAIKEGHIVYNDELVTDMTQSVGDADVASAKAIKTFVVEQATNGGAVFKTESLVVANDRIVLSFAPKNGVVFNFATVRHVDANNVAWDIPVVKDAADLSGKTFLLAPDTTGEFNTKAVLVQYAYTAA